MKAGVALNPHTSISLLEDTIQDIDLVCLMSVNPGFGGQSFIENTYDKVIALKELITQKGASTIIEIDGGVTSKNANNLQMLEQMYWWRVAMFLNLRILPKPLQILKRC